jgi:type VI protein secretion system component Hcp
VRTVTDRERHSKGRTAPAREAEAAEGLAALQSAVGNRALARALSTPAGSRVLQRWWGRRPPAPGGERATYTVTCTLEGGLSFKKKKSFRVLSYQWGSWAEGTLPKPKPKEKEEVKEPKPTFRDIRVTKEQDDLTAILVDAAATGQTIPKMELRTTGGPSVLVYTFTNVLVSSFRLTESVADDKPREEVGFAFEDVTFESR